MVDLISYEPGAYEAALTDGAPVSSPNGAAGEGPGRTNVMAMPTPDYLERVGRLLADGTLRVHFQATYPLDHAVEALQDLATQHSQGKLGTASPAERRTRGLGGSAGQARRAVVIVTGR